TDASTVPIQSQTYSYPIRSRTSAIMHAIRPGIRSCDDVKISPDLFQAYLDCPTKCWLRATGEASTGNIYAGWLKRHDESFRANETARLVGESSNGDVSQSPEAQHLKSAKWQ